MRGEEEGGGSRHNYSRSRLIISVIPGEPESWARRTAAVACVRGLGCNVSEHEPECPVSIARARVQQVPAPPLSRPDAALHILINGPRIHGYVELLTILYFRV